MATPGDTRTGEARSPSAASWQEESLEHLRQAHAFCLECQTSRPKVCATCLFPSCDWCSALEECPGCAQPIPRVNQEQRSQKGKRSLGATVARNLHNMGRAFVERVIDCRYKADALHNTPPVDSIEFLACLTGWGALDRRNRIKDLLSLQSDQALLDKMLNPASTVLIFFPQSQFPDEQPGYGDKGWWYREAEACWIRECRRCKLKHPLEDFNG